MKSKTLLILVGLLFAFTSCSNEQLSNDSLLNETRDPDGCETAFAYAKKGCFLDDEDCKINRWGWVVGPIEAPYNETHELWAGAGQCSLEKGTLVGSVSITYMDDYVVVEYQTIDDWALYETHLYVGNLKYPQKPNGKCTVAPGQYGNSNSFEDGSSYDSYKIDDVSGELYIIAHAVVCPKKKGY